MSISINKEHNFPRLPECAATKANWTKQGKLQLSSGFERFLSAIVPCYGRSKADGIATDLLKELKAVYFGEKSLDTKQKIALTALGYQIYQLQPSAPLENDVASYSKAILLKQQAPNYATPLNGSDPVLDKLGLSSAAQAYHPDLIDFLKANTLIDYMQGAGLKFGAAEDGEPTLPVNGKMMRWSEAKKEIFGNADLKSSLELPLSWRFDATGLQKISVCEWTKLEPCRKEEPHPGKFYVDLMSTTAGLNHAWIRLVNEDGSIISVGLCGQIHKAAMFRGSVGRLNSPDHREFMPEEHRRSRILITQKQYDKLIKKIETDQKTHNFYFNLLSRNCGGYALEVLREIGLIIDNKEFPTQMGIRKLCQGINKAPPEFLIKTVSKILGLVRPIFGTLGTIAMGAWYQDADVKQLEKQYAAQWIKKPNKPFRSWKSYIDGTNSQMLSTFKVADWQNFVERYRKVRLEYLQNLKTDIDESFHNTEKFAKKWKFLEHQVSYEMPPGISDSHLFINQVKHIDTGDLERRVADLVWSE